VCVKVIVEVNDVGVKVEGGVGGDVQKMCGELGGTDATASIGEGYW